MDGYQAGFSALQTVLESSQESGKPVTAVAGKLLQHLREMAPFNSEVDIRLMNEFEARNRGAYGKVCGLVHYFANEIASRSGPDTIAALLEQFRAEMESENPVRRYAAVRTMSNLESKVGGHDSEAVLLEELGALDLLGPLDKHTSAQAMVLLASAKRLLKVPSEKPSPLLDILASGTNATVDSAAREALGGLYYSTFYHPAATWEKWKGFVDGVNLNDPLSSPLYYRILSNLSLSADVPEKERDGCLKRLSSGLQDPNPRAQIELLLRFRWSKLATKVGSKSLAQQILDALLDLSSDAFPNQDTLLMHSLAKVWSQFGKCRLYSEENTEDILLQFVKALKLIERQLETEISDALLKELLSAYIWLIPSPEEKEGAKYLTEFPKIIASLPAAQETVTLVMTVVSPRLIITPGFGVPVLELTLDWCKNSLHALPASTMSAIWIHASASEPKKTLSSIFFFLDLPVKIGEDAWRIQKLRAAAYWVLGQNWASFVQDKKQKFFSAHGGWDLVQNPILRSIIVRLSEGLYFSSWMLRRCAVLSLIKIALAVSDPLKIKLYELLLNIKETYYHQARQSFDDLIDRALDTLDCFYESQADASKEAEFKQRALLFGVTVE